MLTTRPKHLRLTLTIAAAALLLTATPGLFMASAAPPPGKGGGDDGGDTKTPPNVRYTMELVEPLIAGQRTNAGGMNNFGELVGQTRVELIDAETGERTLWGSVFISIPDGAGSRATFDLNEAIDRSDPASATWFVERADDINDSGLIVGRGYPHLIDPMLGYPHYDLDGGGQIHMCVLEETDPGTYIVHSLGRFGNITAVNAEGDLVGGISTAAGWEAFVVVNGHFVELDRGWNLDQEAITDRSENGSVLVVGPYWRAVVDADGNVTALDEFEDPWSQGRFGGRSAAYDVNSFGEIVGDARFSKNEVYIAARYTDAGWEALDRAFSSDSQAFGINESSQIVGRAWDVNRAFLYTDASGMVELDALIDNLPPEMAGTLTPLGITEPLESGGYGPIFGRAGLFSNYEQAFVLVPYTP